MKQFNISFVLTQSTWLIIYFIGELSQNMFKFAASVYGADSLINGPCLGTTSNPFKKPRTVIRDTTTASALERPVLSTVCDLSVNLSDSDSESLYISTSDVLPSNLQPPTTPARSMNKGSKKRKSFRISKKR